jgi:hypothetical protein
MDADLGAGEAGAEEHRMVKGYARCKAWQRIEDGRWQCAKETEMGRRAIIHEAIEQPRL